MFMELNYQQYAVYKTQESPAIRKLLNKRYDDERQGQATGGMEHRGNKTRREPLRTPGALFVRTIYIRARMMRP